MEKIDFFTGIVVPYINFIIFIILAVKLFKKPLTAAFKSQKEGYLKASKEAGEIKKQAEAKYENIKQRADKLDEMVAESKAKAKETADIYAGELLSKAQDLAKHLEDEANLIAQAEIKKARETIQREIMAAVKMSVLEQLRSQLDSDKQLALIKKNIGKINTVKLEG